MRWSWGLLAAVLVLAGAFFFADRAVREAPHLGFVPADADWFVVTDDLPGVWFGTASTDVYATLTRDVPSPLNAIQLRLRKEGGVRFTPARWRLLMGDTFATASASGQQVYVVHPGILARVAEPLQRIVRGFEEADGIVDARTGYYAWRDGFCIASESRALVEASLSAPAIEKERTARSVRWRGAVGESGVEVAMVATDGLPLEVIVDGFAEREDMPNELPSGPWSTEIARVEGLSLETVRELVAAAAAPWSDETKRQVDEILAALPEHSPNTALVLTDVELSEAQTAIEPRVFLIAEDLEDVPRPADAVPMNWGDASGWALPRWDESFTLCYAKGDSRAYFASGQAVMADNLEHARLREPGPAGRLYVNWERVAEEAEHVILQSADYALVEDYTQRDASTKLMPYARSVGMLGETVLTGNVDDGRLVLRGDFATPAVPID